MLKMSGKNIATQWHMSFRGTPQRPHHTRGRAHMDMRQGLDSWMRIHTDNVGGYANSHDGKGRTQRYHRVQRAQRIPR